MTFLSPVKSSKSGSGYFDGKETVKLVGFKEIHHAKKRS